jgi:hypothetical protein
VLYLLSVFSYLHIITKHYVKGKEEERKSKQHSWSDLKRFFIEWMRWKYSHPMGWKSNGIYEAGCLFSIRFSFYKKK